MIAHGCSLFLNERFIKCSDGYKTFVCNICGLFAKKKKDSDDREIYMCQNKCQFLKYLSF